LIGHYSTGGRQWAAWSTWFKGKHPIEKESTMGDKGGKKDKDKTKKQKEIKQVKTAKGNNKSK
jgi:hypothetical protein